MKQNNSQKTLLLSFSLFIAVVILATGGFYYYKGYMERSASTAHTTTTSSNSYYTLRGNATAHQKEIYEEMSTLLNQDQRDDVRAAELVAQNYVADFYTWTNKTRVNDVGGLQYIREDVRKGAFDYALDTFYNDMFFYLDRKEIKDTLEVESSTAKGKEITYNIILTEDEKKLWKETEDVKSLPFKLFVDDKGKPFKQVDAYEVDVTWKYKDSTLLNISEFQTQSTITIVKDADGLYSILEVTDGKTKTN